jgi:hypothetical protein
MYSSTQKDLPRGKHALKSSLSLLSKDGSAAPGVGRGASEDVELLDEAPAFDEPPASDEAPAFDEPPALDEPSASDGVRVSDEAPASDEPSVLDEVPALSEPPASEGARARKAIPASALPEVFPLDPEDTAEDGSAHEVDDEPDSPDEDNAHEADPPQDEDPGPDELSDDEADRFDADLSDEPQDQDEQDLEEADDLPADEAPVAETGEDVPPESAHDEPAPKKHKPKKALRVAGIFFGTLLGLLAAAYGAGVIFFASHFYPNTVIGPHDVSLKSQAEAEPAIAEGLSKYYLRAFGHGLSFEFSAQDLGLSWDEEAIVSNALANRKLWEWPAAVLREHDASGSLKVDYEREGLAADIQAAVATFNETATRPTNASLAFNDKKKVFEIVPEAFGTAIDVNAVFKALGGAIATQQSQLEFTQLELVHALIGKENELLLKANDSANRILKTTPSFTMAGFEVAQLTPDTMAPWIKLTDSLEIVLDSGALNAWIDRVAEGCNTIGSERTYTRPDGKEITIAGGSYGWEVDVDALRTLISSTIAAGGSPVLDLPVIQAGTGFTGIGGRDWGKRYCDIDLYEQYARYYDDEGNCIWESPIISGKPNGRHDTPTGVWMLNGRASPSLLIGEPLPGQDDPEYRTWVTYWMPFVGNAVGLHDATWQPGFGGSMFANGYGSHGCVNLPYYAAEELFFLIQDGDPVISHW